MPVIDVQHLSKRYREQLTVDDLSFSVERGEIFGIPGPNGAGKTTTVEIIGGRRTADAGSVSVLGLDPRRDGDELRQRVGAPLQEAQLPDKLKPWEALDLYSSFYPHPADCEELLDELGLADKRSTAMAVFFALAFPPLLVGILGSVPAFREPSRISAACA